MGAWPGSTPPARSRACCTANRGPAAGAGCRPRCSAGCRWNRSSSPGACCAAAWVVRHGAGHRRRMTRLSPPRARRPGGGNQPLTQQHRPSARVSRGRAPAAEAGMTFEQIDTYGHEQVVYCHNKDAGLKAIIAIHNTVLGPALGGTRMWPYKTEQDALHDVLRLSRGMTYKNAVAGLDIGGGKAVIIGNPATDKSEALFRAFGKAVQSLGGRYITAEDVGIDVNDMEHVFKETEYVTGVHQVHGGSGDPSPFTAYGTLQG